MNISRKRTILFENVYNSCFSKLKHFALQYVMIEEDAENIVQDIFLKLWEKHDLLENHPQLESFLFLSVKNSSLNFLRIKTTSQKVTSMLLEEQAISLRLNIHSLEQFDDSLFSQENIEERLNNAIQNLPERCAEIFRLSKIEGKRQKDIAEQLKISIHTVETQMGIAYKKLKLELSDIVPIIILLIHLSSIL